MTKVQTDDRLNLFRDLNRPSLDSLSYILRHPDTWPKNFVWNYAWCSNCAMGLAHKLWKSSIPTPINLKAAENQNTSTMAQQFGIPYSSAHKIFYEAGASRTEIIEKQKLTSSSFFGFFKTYETVHARRVIGNKAVTPEMVADDIDAYLKTKE